MTNYKEWKKFQKALKVEVKLQPAPKLTKKQRDKVIVAMKLATKEECDTITDKELNDNLDRLLRTGLVEV